MVSGCLAPSRALTALSITTAVQYDGQGWPDLFMAHPDRGVMAIEWKSVRGRLTVEQSSWLDTLAPSVVPTTRPPPPLTRLMDVFLGEGDPP